MELFTQLALMIFLSALLGVLMDKLKQPSLLGYILAGWLVSQFTHIHGETEVLLDTFSELGVTLLLFLVGMELSWPKLKSVGKAALSTGIGQIVFTTLGGILLSTLLGFSWISSLYIAIALTFSSTIIIVKLLSEKNDLQSLHGRIAVGMLLVQDFVAIMVLILLTGLGNGGISPLTFIELSFKFIFIVLGVIASTKYIIPNLIKHVAHSTELLFVSSVAWGIGIAALMAWSPIGLSIEVGGFIAGITIASSLEQHQILSRLRPLRDFFIMIFFVSLGSGLDLSGVGEMWLAVLIFSLFVLIGNPLIVMFIMRNLNYRSRTSFLTSLTVAQISEFSLIVIALGQKIGHVPDHILGVITLVGALTMTGSTYMILGAEKIWKKYQKWLKLIEKKGSSDIILDQERDWKNHAILIGCDRTGKVILNRLKKKNIPIVVVDFNPHIVEELNDKGIDVIYGDSEDIDTLELVNITQSKLIISTVIDKEATLMLLEHLNHSQTHRKPHTIVTAAYQTEAELFYENGANYVIIPKMMTGMYVGDMIVKYLSKGKEIFVKENKKRQKYLAYT